VQQGRKSRLFIVIALFGREKKIRKAKGQNPNDFFAYKAGMSFVDSHAEWRCFPEAWRTATGSMRPL
jgi:hypothetical protein